MKDTSCGSSSVGRALASQAKGHEFESRLPLQMKRAINQPDLWLLLYL